MSDIIDHYPETLRDIHDMILDAISGDDITAVDAGIAVHVTEWIRRHWGGRTLTRKWWGMMSIGELDTESGTLIEVTADQVRTMHGHELRAAAWTILAGHALLWTVHGRRDICQLATIIAVTVETEWTRAAIYIPAAKEVDRAIRDSEVWRSFSGLGEIDRVIEKFGLSQRQIYDIANRVQDDKDRREQPCLPGF